MKVEQLNQATKGKTEMLGSIVYFKKPRSHIDSDSESCEIPLSFNKLLKQSTTLTNEGLARKQWQGQRDLTFLKCVLQKEIWKFRG